MIRTLTLSVALLTITYVLLAVVGAFQSYSPVPFWDMWDGYLDFYVKASEGDWGAWWDQHNEHRILLSRILFWIDIQLFSGRMIFLIAVNFLLIVSICIVFRKIILAAFGGQFRYLAGLFCLVAFSLLFSWTQRENITWAFQSQFFLAQLLPLIAFYLLFESEQKKSPLLYFASCVTGCLASISMANGITALPVLVLLAIMLRTSISRTVILAVLSIISVLLYFHDYVAPAGHGSLATVLLEQPWDVVRYVLLYLGAPFYYITGKGSHVITQIGGLFLVGSCVYFSYQSVKTRADGNIKFVLLAFLLYVGGTALATAGGRVIFGVEQALAGRYMTPVIMAWIALALLYAGPISRFFQKKPASTVGILLFVQLLFLPAQLRALDDHSEANFRRLVAALALEMGVPDENKIKSIFPSYEWIKELSNSPRKKNLSVFGHPFIEDVSTRLGSRLSFLPGRSCLGALDEVTVLQSDNRFASIRGWLFDATTAQLSGGVFLVDANNTVIGYALLGASRPDVKTAVHEEAGHAGFEGYIRSGGYNGELRLVASTCSLPVVLSELPYAISHEAFGGGSNIASVGTVLESDWGGSDYYRSKHPSFVIYGTYIESDSDIGRIKLKMSDGDSFYYRSGPSNGGQILKLNDKLYSLPISTEWVLLTLFVGSDGPHEVILEDVGRDWGQWSAIALKK